MSFLHPSSENHSGGSSKPPPMTEESGARVSSDASQTRQRKKRKWDQPAESLVSAGLAVPGALPLGNVGLLGGIGLPGVSPVSSAHLINPLAAGFLAVPQAYQVPLIPQQAATVLQKLIQPKIQDELIAREIVINDAESSIRYKLTKRQTQEEIQRCTGAVVITRGKYRPPDASSDGEKPLYLHISAGANIKETTERILAVDRAAAMVEDMLKQGQNLHPASLSSPSVMSNGVKESSMCVYLGFDADPSMNIAARIRGPSDQYINHIMNETGATVLLRGRGSASIDSLPEGQKPLHLLLSSNNLKSLEDARLLAEHLLNTISVECGISRVSSSKVYSAIAPPQQVYSAVPPPNQLSAGVLSSGNEMKAITTMVPATVGLTPAPPVSSVGTSVITTGFSQGIVHQSGGLLNCVQSQASSGGCPQPLSGGMIYGGYGGIYPQVTPLQQVALALRLSTSPTTSTISPTTSVPGTEPKFNSKFSSDSEEEKRRQQRRKFQELPVSSKGHAKVHQELDSLKRPELALNLGLRNVSTMPAPKKLVQQVSNGMPPPPPRTMPPPPPKSASSAQVVKGIDKNNVPKKIESDSVPDTLIKLMEYGEDDDDDSEETDEQSTPSNSLAVTAGKPFWAL
ncbi:protein RIK isoform X2 [Argentina anserina]|uniref:protein RIK isoform X2 n=1 Tax=Argentina anserina TaxID=57926 RepID=UPI00217670F0|nr:protein RIK isoform X2 [Potentilla anserina]